MAKRDERDSFPGFAECMRLMRRRDPQQMEDGFHLLQARAHEFVPELIAEFRGESKHGLRCWLLELLGYARSEAAYPLFLEFLESEDESLRDWAIRGLRELDTKEARRTLWAANLHPRSPGMRRARDGA